MLRRPGSFLRPLAGGLIVIVALGCDNVSWGGASMSLEPPPSKDPTAAPATPETPAAPTLPPGELLFAATVEDTATVLTALAFVDGTGAFPLPSLQDPTLGPMLLARLASADEVTLFAEGTRVGSVLVGPDVGEDVLCLSQPTLSGKAELRQDLAGGSTFIGMTGRGADPGHGSVEPPPQIRDVRAATLTMAGDQINDVGAVWPPRDAPSAV